MAQVIYSGEAIDDVSRLFEYLARSDPYSASAAVTAIRSAIDILSDHPMIGRRIDVPLRELVISFGRSGYIALYRFKPERDEVRILAIRHQREIDYSG